MYIKPRLYRGMRDFLPEDMLPREKMMNTVRETFRKWGFSPISTPAIEHKEILQGKYGESADRLIYSIEHKDDIALRYDLTVPLARVVSMYSQDLPTPFKRYQIQEVWRAERAQPRQGRFREFLQCDVDTVGTDSLCADSEILALSVELLSSLGFPDSLTLVNHRAILRGLMEVSGFPESAEMDICRVIDKLAKIGEEKVKELLLDEGYQIESVDSLFEIILKKGDNIELLDFLHENYSENPNIARGVADLREIFSLLENFGVSREKFELDLSLARGLDYYTGTIFESVIPAQPHIGSLTGGGRYDELIGLFSKKPIPAVGITIGLDRIIAALADAGRSQKINTPTRVLVTVFSENLINDSIELATRLRKAEIPAEVYLQTDRFKKQFSYADKLGIPYVAIIGENEKKASKIALKEMKSGKQELLDFEEFVARMK